MEVEVITFKDFDWSQTNTDLLFLIPNFGRGRYIRKTIDNLLNTSVPKDRFKILIINDGIHESFEDLKDKNVLYFTLERSPLWERGDGFSRNLAIKYSQSKLIAQKDPEIIYSGDFIKGCLDHQDELYRCGNLAYQASEVDTNEYFDDQIDLVEVYNGSRRIPIMEDRFVFYHYGFCVQTQTLRDIGGYDEDYKYYCFADMDLYQRLMKFGVKPYFDRKCEALHLSHNKPDTKNDPIAILREQKNKAIYESKKNGNIIRNVGKIWGEGDSGYEPEIV